MADMENTPPVGTKSTGGTEETQASSADITPSRRSSRKKQSTFSSDFEYYTPTGRKVETQEKPSPHLEQKVQQKKGDKKAQNNEDVELEDQEEEVEQSDDKSSKKQIQKKKVAQRKQKIIAEEEEEEDSDEIEKPKVVKGKPKIAAKKIQKSAGLTQKKKVVAKQEGKINESEDSSDEEEEEKDTTKAIPGKKRKLVGSGGKKKQTMLKKPKVGGKKKAAKDDGDEEGESSSDEEDSTPISQLQAQLKKTHESPLAQNLAKKLAEVDADSDDESNKSLATLAGQKRKLQKDGGAEPVSSKQVLKASQFEKLGSALASLVKRLPSDLVKRTPSVLVKRTPSDLVKRSPSEIAAKSGKEAVHNGLPATKQETAKPEATSSVKTVFKDAIMKPVSNQGAVKLDTKTTEEKSTKDLLKQALLNKPQKSKDVKVTQLKGVEGNKLQEPDELKVAQTKITPQGKPDSNSATPQKPTAPPRRLTEEEIRQKKIAEIKAKIAEKSGAQKNMFVKKKKDLVETSGSQIKKDIKKEDLQHKKVKQGESHVKEQARKFSNVPPHLLKKRKALGKKLGSHSAHAENVLKKGIVHKRKSHQPFGNKNVVVKKFSDKKLSGDTEKPNDEKVKVDKPQDVNPDKGNKVGEERRKSVEKKRKSIDSVKDDKRKSAKREQRKSSEGSKKISDEKKRKSVGNEELQEKKMDDDGPPLLVHADSTPAKSKHKTHKVEHEVPLDMSMNDLFKPDVIPITQETEVSTPGGDAHDPSLVLSEEAQNVLLEHQYSKPSSPVAGVSGLSKKDSDIESVSHRAVMVDANLPDQILEDVTEDSNSRESETDVGVANDGNGDTKLPAGKNDDNPVERECIMKQLDSELKAGGSDFIIVGQVEISRLTPPSSAEKQSSPSDKDIASKRKKDNEIVDTESGSRKRKDSVSTDKEIAGKKRRDSETSGKELLSKKRRDSETGSEKRKSSTDSKEARLVKQKEKSHEKKGSKQKKDAEKGKNTSENDEDEESAEDEDFEDDENDIDWEDPDMLYCLCRKPHNNRFMICCDKCEEWYHGTCVGVTRARGKEMEDNEEEYVCPVCLKGESEPLIEKSHESSKSSEGSTPSSKLTQKCVGRKCNKVPRPGSVYCSNECIMNHAQESLKAIREEQAKKSSKEKHSSSQDSSSKSSSSKSPSADIVEVMERETGKILRGSQAPTQKGLHQWLEQHPSFEVVQPQQKHRSSSSRDSKDGRRKSSSDKDHRSSSSTSSSSSSNSKDRKYEKSDNRSHHRHHKDSSSRRESTSSSNSSSKDHASKRIDRDRRHSSSSSSSSTPSHKADNSSSKKSDRGSDSVRDHNQIRSNVKTALRDSLSARARDAEDIQLSSSEIKALSATIEEELYSLFNDTGHKYRAKYRSLIFNIKDPKNKGLFRKILVGKIKPDQLVQMSTEDLASRELAKWREQESKHQLEMIQKLELAKQTEKTVAHVTKKTHKGEIEVDDEDMSTLETHLEEKISAEPEKAEDQSQEPVIDTTSQHRAHLFDLNCKVCTGKIVPGPEEQMATNTPTAKKKKKLGVQFALHENQEREIEPLEDIEENDENFENNVSEKEDIKYDQIKDEKKEEEEVKEADYVKAAEIVKEALEHVHKAEAEMSALPSMVSSSPKHGERTPSPPISPKEEPPYMDKFDDDDDDDIKVSGSNTNVETGGTGGSGSYSDVGDKKSSALPKHAGTEGLLLSVPKSVSLPSSSVKVGAEKKVIVRSPDSPLQAGLEAKGKFTPTGPVLWKGFVSMLDVAKFFTSAYRVSGPTDHISIQDTIHIMGRISPDHMWDYLSKIRQSGSKDVTVLRFIPGSDEEKVAYIHLYSYLNSRSRCGVANNPSSKVKDFYIVPLASHSKIPRTLLPFDGPGLEENRPHMLIGILVRQRDKHSKDISSGSPHTSSSTKASKLSSSKVKAATGTTRDPRLAKLTSKTSSPKQSPSSSNSSGTAEVKQAETGAKDEIEEYDPEYVPVLVKAKSSTEQPVAEYIPTVKAQDKVKGSSPKEVTSTDKSKKHHHHHHHKEHHRHHKKDTAEDDSEPYSPGKEAEPYSPGQEAAAEEPYDPEDESLMDEEGHPIESAASTQAAVPASATTPGSTTAKVDSIVSVTPASTQASSDSQSKDSVQPSVQIDDLVEQMARSSDPAQISSLMVSALSKASTQQEQQQLLVRLTRQVEERKLQLATEASSSKDASDAQAVSSSGDTATQSAETDKSSEQVTPANVVSKPTDTASNNKADILKDIGRSGKSSSGISFSIKSVDKPGSLTPSAVFSEKKTEEQKTELLGTLQKGPEQTGDEDKKPGDAQLPDALQALMNDVLGNTQISSLERRSKMLMKKDADRVAEQEKKLAAEKEEREKGDEDLEAEKIKMQQEAALEEARKRDEDEMEARKILESMKQPKSTHSEVKSLTPAESSSGASNELGRAEEKPTKAPTIDELLERLKKGGFQFPIQKADENPSSVGAGLGETSSVSATAETTSTTNTAPSIQGTSSSLSLSVSSSSSSSLSSSSISTMSSLPLTSNPCVPTYTGSKPVLPSSTLLSSSTSAVDLLSSSVDTDLRQQIPPSSKPLVASSSSAAGIHPASLLQDRDERQHHPSLHKEDRDDRPFRGSGAKHPLDPHAFPPLPSSFEDRRSLPPHPSFRGSSEYPPPYQPTPRSILPPPKARAQPPPPGTEFDRPAEVLGITDVDLRQPPLPPPLPPEPPPPLPPLPHQYHEDVDYRGADPFRGHHPHHPSHSYRGRPYSRH